jgi:hypothetical protein
MATLTVRAETPEPEADHDATPSFWQRPVVQDVLPFLTSLLLHVSLIAVGVLTYQAATLVIHTSQAPLVIPDGVTVDAAERSLVPPTNFQGLNPLANLPTLQDVDPTADPNSKGLSDKAALLKTLSPAGGGAGASDDAEIALGLDKNFGKGKGGGSGLGDGLGGGTGDGLGLAPFGKRQVGGGTPTFRGAANKVVFLCDSSGSMLT